MSKTVLILDDEPDIRELLAIALEGPDLHCELTGHLSDAKSLLQRLKPDFVVTDINVPDGSGLDLLSYVREHAPGTPCVVITAYGDMDSAVTALRAGAVDYLTKPINMRDLKRVIKSRLEAPPATPAAAPSNPPASKITPEPSKDSADKVVLLQALEDTRWNKRAAAAQLGMSYRQFRYRLEKHGIQ